ncbi:hypothetical protein Glove_320g4 [Diversispora epigaea]|uniref:Uncharacterized protein n=1 Tax=Diversispora epigaea TaxID=1348612 RepID=A0A397HS87_9GLOM|nr:hypothetical protein Glove_320g4 [Diversispora epigaea]
MAVPMPLSSRYSPPFSTISPKKQEIAKQQLCGGPSKKPKINNGNDNNNNNMNQR